MTHSIYESVFTHSGPEAARHGRPPLWLMTVFDDHPAVHPKMRGRRMNIHRTKRDAVESQNNDTGIFTMTRSSSKLPST